MNSGQVETHPKLSKIFMTPTELLTQCPVLLFGRENWVRAKEKSRFRIQDKAGDLEKELGWLIVWL